MEWNLLLCIVSLPKWHCYVWLFINNFRYWYVIEIRFHRNCWYFGTCTKERNDLALPTPITCLQPCELLCGYACCKPFIYEFLELPSLSHNKDLRLIFGLWHQEMKIQGVEQDRLQLLRDVSGAFRPGILTALVGVSGAGKTTLMDVLAGRKTAGYIEGSISISGYPKKQETFARSRTIFILHMSLSTNPFCIRPGFAFLQTWKPKPERFQSQHTLLVNHPSLDLSTEVKC